MKLGALLGPILDPTQTRWLADQADGFAQAGYDSLWSAQAIGRGFMMTDPFVALTVAAQAAPGLELGTAVLQLPLYAANDVAHRAFSLQQLTAAPLVVGVGAGSTEADFQAFGRDFGSRFADLDAGVGSLRESLREGQTAQGNLSPWPSVLNKPEIFLGSWGKGVLRAANEFDGWIASAHYRTVDQVCAALGEYRAAGGGRAIVSTIQISGDTDEAVLRESLERFATAGFDDAVVMLLPGAPSPSTVRKWLS